MSKFMRRVKELFRINAYHLFILFYQVCGIWCYKKLSCEAVGKAVVVRGVFNCPYSRIKFFFSKNYPLDNFEIIRI